MFTLFLPSSFGMCWKVNVIAYHYYNDINTATTCTSAHTYSQRQMGSNVTYSYSAGPENVAEGTEEGRNKTDVFACLITRISAMQLGRWRQCDLVLAAHSSPSKSLTSSPRRRLGLQPLVSCLSLAFSYSYRGTFTRTFTARMFYFLII